MRLQLTNLHTYMNIYIYTKYIVGYIHIMSTDKNDYSYDNNVTYTIKMINVVDNLFAHGCISEEGALVWRNNALLVKEQMCEVGI